MKNKNVIKAVNIGLSTMMAVSPVTTVLADEVPSEDTVVVGEENTEKEENKDVSETLKDTVEAAEEKVEATQTVVNGTSNLVSDKNTTMSGDEAGLAEDVAALKKEVQALKEEIKDFYDTQADADAAKTAAAANLEKVVAKLEEAQKKAAQAATAVDTSAEGVAAAGLAVVDAGKAYDLAVEAYNAAKAELESIMKEAGLENTEAEETEAVEEAVKEAKEKVTAAEEAKKAAEEALEAAKKDFADAYEGNAELVNKILTATKDFDKEDETSCNELFKLLVEYGLKKDAEISELTFDGKVNETVERVTYKTGDEYKVAYFTFDTDSIVVKNVEVSFKNESGNVLTYTLDSEGEPVYLIDGKELASNINGITGSDAEGYTVETKDVYKLTFKSKGDVFFTNADFEAVCKLYDTYKSAKEALNDAKKALDEADSALDKVKEEINNADLEDDIRNLEKEIAELKAATSGLETAKDNAAKVLETAESDVTAKSEALADAKKALEEAKKNEKADIAAAEKALADAYDEAILSAIKADLGSGYYDVKATKFNDKGVYLVEATKDVVDKNGEVKRNQKYNYFYSVSEKEEKVTVSKSLVTTFTVKDANGKVYTARQETAGSTIYMIKTHVDTGWFDEDEETVAELKDGKLVIYSYKYEKKEDSLTLDYKFLDDRTYFNLDGKLIWAEKAYVTEDGINVHADTKYFEKNGKSVILKRTGKGTSYNITEINVAADSSKTVAVENYDSLVAAIATAKNKVTNLTTVAGNAQTAYDSAVTTRDNAKAAYKNAEDAYNTNLSSITSKTTELDELKADKSKVDAAVSVVNEKQAAADKAQEAFDTVAYDLFNTWGTSVVNDIENILELKQKAQDIIDKDGYYSGTAYRALDEYANALIRFKSGSDFSLVKKWVSTQEEMNYVAFSNGKEIKYFDYVLTDKASKKADIDILVKTPIYKEDVNGSVIADPSSVSNKTGVVERGGVLESFDIVSSTKYVLNANEANALVDEEEITTATELENAIVSAEEALEEATEEEAASKAELEEALEVQEKVNTLVENLKDALERLETVEEALTVVSEDYSALVTALEEANALKDAIDGYVEELEAVRALAEENAAHNYAVVVAIEEEVVPAAPVEVPVAPVVPEDVQQEAPVVNQPEAQPEGETPATDIQEEETPKADGSTEIEDEETPLASGAEESTKNNTAPIVGGIFAFILALLGITAYAEKKRREKKAEAVEKIEK